MESTEQMINNIDTQLIILSFVMSKKLANREERRKLLNRYLDENVKPVFDRLITELLASMPDDLVQVDP